MRWIGCTVSMTNLAPQRGPNLWLNLRLWATTLRKSGVVLEPTPAAAEMAGKVAEAK